MTAWVLYSLLVATCVAGAAHALERVLRSLGRPVRWVWLAGVLGSVGVPLGNWIVLRLSQGASPLPSGPASERTLAALLATQPLHTYEVVGALPSLVDAAVAVIWMLMSAIFISVLAWSSWRLARERRTWKPAVLGGTPVWRSACTGPAVVGLFRHTVVMPSWVFDLDRGAQRLISLHEGEHVRAGDLRLTLVALGIVALVPWNPALWWQWRKLRLAVETDCDRRVIRGGADPRRYGSLLLELGGRARHLQVLGLALTERKSLLARRIEMLTYRPGSSAVRVGAALAVAGGLAMLACETPAPLITAEQPDPSQAVAPSTAATPAYAESEVDRLPERISGPRFEYPEALRQEGIEGLVMITAVVDDHGLVVPGSVEIISSSHEGFNESAIALVAGSEFKPGLVDGKPVHVQIQMPIQFSLKSK